MPTAQPMSESSPDPYAGMLSGLLPTNPKRLRQRQAWFEALEVLNKEDILFEFEMLLKGLVCFFNPRNQPRSAAKPIDRQNIRSSSTGKRALPDTNFYLHAWVTRDAIDRAVTLIRQLDQSQEQGPSAAQMRNIAKAGPLARPLMLLPTDQSTPQESLRVLGHGLSHAGTMIEGLLQADYVSEAAYRSAVVMVARLVGENRFFNPLTALAFSPEYDAIEHPEMLEALGRFRSEHAARMLSVALLSFYRGLRYLAFADRCNESPLEAQRAYVFMAALRNDLRTLTRYIGRRSGDLLAEGFESTVLFVRATDIQERFEQLHEFAGQLISLRGGLENLANVLRIEVRKVFDYDLPPIEALPSANPRISSGTHDVRISRHSDSAGGDSREALQAGLALANADLRASLQHAVTTLYQRLNPTGRPLSFDTEESARTASYARFRRDVWMFMQILRAFVAKAQAARYGSDSWESHASYQFVRDFFAYFRALGYQLVRAHGYDRFEFLLSALKRVRDADLVDPLYFEQVIDECSRFHDFLRQRFEGLSNSPDLALVPFDQGAAAEMLKRYLGR